MKKTLLSLITITFFLCEASFTGGGMAFAATILSGDCGTGLTATLDGTTLTISGSGAMKNWTSSNYTNATPTTGRPWQSDASSITKVIIESGVTSIGNYAFRGMTELTTVTYKSTYSVTSIGDYAFYGCTKLTSLSPCSSVTTIGQNAYYGCTEATSISIPKNVTSIGNYAFYGCSNVTSSLTFGGSSSNLATIGNYAFQNCAKISSITIPKKVTSIGSNAFNGCTTASSLTFTSTSTVATIGSNAFKSCEKITSVSIPASVTSIGTDAFYFCYALKTVTFEDRKTAITLGNYLFEDCTALTSITFPSTLTTIPSQTFHGCTALETLIIPSAVTNITNTAFTECSALKTIIAYPSTHPNLSGTVSSLTNFTPANVRVAVFTSAAKTNYKNDNYWSAFDIDTKIEGSCGASATYSLDLTDGTLTISGSGAMDTYSTSVNSPWYLYRDLITSVVVESGITGIGAYAFRYCENITSVSIPASVTSIGTYAFDGCKGLISYTYAGTLAQWLNITFGGSASNPMYYVKKCYVNGSTEVNDLVIPNGTTAIKNYAFYNCSGLTSVTLPASLTSSGSAAFSTCTNIANVNFLGNIDQWCSIAFSGNTSNPAMYSHQLSINGVEQTDIYLADELSLVKAYVFYNNDALTTISLRNTTSIDPNALVNCNADLTIRGELTGSCGTNVNWSLLDGVLTISGTGAMNNYLSNSIPWYAYRNMIRQVIVEEGVTTIGNGAFYQCVNIENLSLPEGLTSIGSSVMSTGPFSQLRELTIPSTVTSIGYNAFQACSVLEKIVVMRTSSVPIITGSSGYMGVTEYNCFQNCYSSAYLLVYIDLKDSYSTANGWKRFTNKNNYWGYCGAEDEGMNLTWMYNSSASTLTISGTGAMADYASASAMPWNSFKTSITSIVIEDDVTTIGQRAFYGCTALTSVTFPETFSAIGNYAFYNCSGLTSIALPEGITAIGNSAFYGCTSLASVTLPSTLTSIGSNAFINDALTSIIIPSSVTSIGSGAFKGNAALVSVGLAEAPQLTTIGNSAFENCSSLTSITIPNKVTSIGNSSFSGCSLLAAVNYGDTPTLATIGYSAFKNCSSLTSITIPESVTTITGNSNQNVYTPFAGCTSLTTVIWNARNCSGWTPINYMSSTYYQMPFESIKTQITSFKFGSNVQSIPQYLCHGMTGLTDITIPASVTAIGANAFDGCTNITTVTSNATSVPSIASSTFPSSVEDAATLYVPSTVASRTAYSNDTYWSAFDHILPYVLTFDLQEHGDDIDPICVNAGRVDEILKPADPTETGYTFGGWYSNEGCTTPFTFGESGTVVNGDLTLYALWTINSYGVTFDLQGHGDPIAPQSINYNGLVSEPSAPSEDYYTFGGWYKEAGCSNTWDFSEDKVTDDLTLYAKWTLKGLALNENADNSSAISAYDGLTTNVTMTRSLTNAQYNTFCLPFSLSAEVMTEKFGAGYDLEELTDVAYNAGELTLEFTKRDELEAGKPYLLQPVNIVENPSFAEVTISNAAPSDGLNNAYLAFHGIYSPTELEGGNHNLLFLGAGNELFWPATTGSMKGFRGYFEIKSPALAAVRARIVKKEDAATGIEEVRSENANAVRSEKILRSGQLLILRDGKTYNAQGMLVE